MLTVDADVRPSADDLLEDIWFTCETKKKNSESDIANAKKLFKAKILAKVPVEKNKNTIYLGA